MDDSFSARTPPRPKGRGGGASSGALVGILKIAGVVVLAAGAAFAVYTFVWPMFSGGGDSTTTADVTSTTTVAETPDPTPPAADPNGGGSEDPAGPAGPAGPDGPAPQPRTDPRAGAPPTPAPATTTEPAPAATTTAPRPRPAPAPSPAPPPSGSGGNGRQLLAGGDISGAANAFLQELRSSGRNKFTVAVGLYCDEENVGRVVQSARGAMELYVLPTTIQGRRCFRVVWGTYDSRQAAEQGMGSLPSGLRAGDAAAVPVASVLR